MATRSQTFHTAPSVPCQFWGVVPCKRTPDSSATGKEFAFHVNLEAGAAKRFPKLKRPTGALS